VLTVKQVIMIETHNPFPPLRASALASLFPARPMKLRSVINTVSSQKVYLTLQPRDSNLLQIAGSSTPLQSLWPHAVPSRATLVQFSQLLNANGVALIHLSKDWQTLIVSGTKGTLPALKVLAAALPDPTALGELAASATIVDGVLLTIGFASGPVGWVAIASVTVGLEISGFTAGALAYDGLLRLNASDEEGGSPITGVSVGDATLYGGLPTGVTENDLGTLPPLDVELNNVPDIPGFPPLSCPVVCPPPVCPD
jgi:hypothetical protein